MHIDPRVSTTPVQAQFIGVLHDLRSTRMPAASVRLASGTTVSLRDRVDVGTFSEALFYRLNVMHLIETPS